MTPENIQKLARAIVNQATKQMVDVKQADISLIYRYKGKRITPLWGEGSGGWQQELMDGLVELTKQKQSLWCRPEAALEINLTYNWRILPATKRLFANSQRGLLGIEMRFKSHLLRFTPTDMISRNLAFDRAFELFQQQCGEDESKIPEREQVEIRLFEAVQFFIRFDEAGKVTICQLYRGNQVVVIEKVTQGSVASLAEGMAGWMHRAVQDNGRLIYKYWPSNGNESNAVNLIRLFMGTLCLFKQADYYARPEYRQAAELNLRFQMQQFYQQEGRLGFVDEGGKVKLGACALVGLCLMASENDYSAELSAIYATIDHLWQEGSGEFHTFLKPESRNDCQNFYPGEAMLFWAEYWRRNQSDVLLSQIDQSFRYYRQFHRSQRNPAFIPWHTQALAILWQETGNTQYRDFIFEMNDWLLPVQQWDGITQPDIKGRFHDPKRPFGPPHASSTGVYLEGLIDAYTLAQEAQDNARQEAYATAIKRGLRSLIQLQFKSEVDMFYIQNQERVRGGLRTTVYNNEIRVDNIQHGLMGILQILRSDVLIP